MNRGAPLLLAGFVLSACFACFACDSSPERTQPTHRSDAGPHDGGSGGSGDAGTTVVDCNRHAQGPLPEPADILFVVDNSGPSMVAVQDRLGAAFCAFTAALPEGSDYQIGVVTTDLMTSGGEKTGQVTATYSSVAPFNLQDVVMTSCSDAMTMHGCIRGSSMERIVRSPAVSVPNQSVAFSDDIRVGSCGSGLEEGLGAMIAALGQAGAGQCNEGFLRDNARLVVILVSDEDDGDQTPIAGFVQQLFGVKANGKLRVATITGAVGGTAASCRSPESTTCGHSVCDNPPPEGSHMPCSIGGTTCPTGEFCRPAMAGEPTPVCESDARRFFTPDTCGWCSYFNAPDCCSALHGTRYVDFAKSMERMLAALDGHFTATGCRAQAGATVACLIESICSDDLAPVMAELAAELVLK